MPTAGGKKTNKEKRAENQQAFAYGQEVLSKAEAVHLEGVVRRAKADGAKFGFVDDPKTIDYVLIALSEGSTFNAACRALQVDQGTLRLRLLADAHLHMRYVRAREHQSEALADANDVLLFAPLQYDAEGSSVELLHRKAIVENRRWLMGKNHVRRFGDKVTIAGDPDNPVRTISREMTQEECAAAWAEDTKRQEQKKP